MKGLRDTRGKKTKLKTRPGLFCGAKFSRNCHRFQEYLAKAKDEENNINPQPNRSTSLRVTTVKILGFATKTLSNPGHFAKSVWAFRIY